MIPFQSFKVGLFSHLLQPIWMNIFGSQLAGGPRLIPISLLQFFKTSQIYLANAFFGTKYFATKWNILTKKMHQPNVWLMRNLANTTFSQNQKLHLVRILWTYSKHVSKTDFAEFKTQFPIENFLCFICHGNFCLRALIWKKSKRNVLYAIKCKNITYKISYS